MSNYAMLTLTDLERAGACAPQRELFARLAPDGVPLVELEAYNDSYLDKHYGGANDECSICFIDGKIVKISDCRNHYQEV